MLASGQDGLKGPQVFRKEVAFELSLEGGLASGEWPGGGRQWAGAQGRPVYQAGGGFEVLAGRSWAGPGRRSPPTIRSDRQGGARLRRRANSRLGIWTLPRRQWGATGVSEQGRAAPAVAPLFFPDRAELCSISASPLDGDILANLKRPAFPGHQFPGRKTNMGTPQNLRVLTPQHPQGKPQGL